MAEKDWQRLANAIRKAFVGFGILGLLLCLGILVGSKPFVELTGEQYQATGELLFILSPILFLKSLSYACAAFLVAVDWQRNRVIVQAASALTNVILNLVIISTFGIWGGERIW
jgi:O-antigen/teichoic acid export membrane protein